MNLWKEILLCINRSVVLFYISGYVFNSIDWKETGETCLKMRSVAISLTVVCYFFILSNLILLCYFLYLWMYSKFASFEMELVVKLDLLDVLMFFLFAVNIIALNFLYSSTCGEFTERMLHLIITFWFIVSFCALFGYFIYKKIFLHLD